MARYVRALSIEAAAEAMKGFALGLIAFVLVMLYLTLHSIGA